MNPMLRKWYDLSIRAKSLLLMGVMLAAMWVLVALVMLQLRSFSSQADVIMNDYSDITAFLDAYSAENVWLEAYIRPSMDAEDSYRQAIAQTDLCLPALRPDWRSGAQEENALKRSLINAMEWYRTSQQVLLEMDGEDPAFIDQYLSLKTQSAYIDGYARELLYTRMDQGGE